MPQLPRADFFVAKQSGPSQVLADPGMLNAEGQGLQQLGAGISQVASNVSQYAQAREQIAQRLDHANFVAKSAEADRKVKTAWSSYQEEMLTKQAKPEEWVKGWNDTYAKVSKDVDMSGLSKSAQVRVQEQMKSFQADSTSQISLQATKQRIRNGQAEITASAGLDLKNGDWAGYEAKINEGTAAGFFDPAMHIQLMVDGKKQFAFEQANKAINENPFAAKSALEQKTESGKWANYGDLDENRRLSLVREADTYISKERAATVQGLVDRQGAGEILSSAELDGLVQAGKLLPTQARWALQQQKRTGQDPELIVGYANLLSAIDKYQPSQDPTNSQFAELQAQQLKYPAELRSEINRRLTEAKSNASTKRKEGYDYVDSLLSGHFLGNIDKSTSGTGAPTNKAEYLQAHQKAVDLRQQLDEFLKQKPTATGPEQIKFINELTAKDRTTQLAGMINKQSSTPSPKSQKEYDLLPIGSTYLAPDGTMRVKTKK